MPTTSTSTSPPAIASGRMISLALQNSFLQGYRVWKFSGHPLLNTLRRSDETVTFLLGFKLFYEISTQTREELVITVTCLVINNEPEATFRDWGGCLLLTPGPCYVLLLHYNSEATVLTVRPYFLEGGKLEVNKASDLTTWTSVDCPPDYHNTFEYLNWVQGNRIMIV